MLSSLSLWLFSKNKKSIKNKAPIRSALSSAFAAEGKSIKKLSASVKSSLASPLRVSNAVKIFSTAPFLLDLANRITRVVVMFIEYFQSVIAATVANFKLTMI